jgi:outer membrane protein insertion porin family
MALVQSAKISDIEYRFDGVRKVDESLAAAHLRLKVGETFTQEAADASIRALYRTGFYEFVSIDPELRTRAVTNSDGSVGSEFTVHLNVLLQPRLRVSSVKFEGNTEWDAESFFGNNGLMDESAIRPGDPLDEVLVKRTVEKLIKKYDAYYPFAEITPRIDRDDAKGTASVTFVIKENQVIKIDSITFVGNEHITDTDLRPEIDTSSWAWTFDPEDFPGWRFAKFSFISNYGRFHKEEFRNDLGKLRSFYRNQGFLDVEIPDEAVEQKIVDTSGDKSRLAITIKISEGRRYTVGDVKVEGNTLGGTLPGEKKLTDERIGQVERFKTESILKYLAQRRRDLTRPYPVGDRVHDLIFSGGVRARAADELRTNFDSLEAGDWYSPKAVETALEKLRDYYGEWGYLNTFVTVQRRPNIETGKVDLVFHVTEGTKTYLNSINIRGNNRTRTRVIVRELVMAPGEVFDTVRMKNSERILRNTRFFDDVRLSPEVTNANIPNRRDLRIEVHEAPTGSLSFGVGFSTVEQLVGYAEYSESNFDLFNWRNYFRGGGQKFRLRLSIGTISSAIEQSFEEPWLGGRELALGYNAYLTSDSYASSDYETQRLGVNVYLRRRIFEEVYAKLDYTIEDTRLRQVAWNVPDFIRQDKGSNLISKVGLSLYRDTRNDVNFPTYGNRFSLSQYVAGGPLGGDVNYYQVEARAAQWIPIFETGEQTLQILARVGAMVSYGSKKHIPFYELFHLGGAYTMRGFKYQHIGPFEGDEATGGKTYGFASAEYTIKLFEQLRFAIFYDWGFVNRKGFDFDTSSFNDDVGFGFRILVMGAVMRIDIGVPITSSKDNDDGVRFNFSFGTVF